MFRIFIYYFALVLALILLVFEVERTKTPLFLGYQLFRQNGEGIGDGQFMVPMYQKLSKKLLTYITSLSIFHTYTAISPENTKKQNPLALCVKKCCVPRWQVAPSTLTCEGSPGGNSLAVL